MQALELYLLARRLKARGWPLTAGERQEDMKFYCDRSFEVRPAPAALAVTAQLQDAVNSSFWYKVCVLKKTPSLELRDVSFFVCSRVNTLWYPCRPSACYLQRPACTTQ
jgi:hypothetical protein